jgi:hypothetical protein
MRHDRVDWISLVDTGQYEAFVNLIMNLRVP